MKAPRPFGSASHPVYLGAALLPGLVEQSALDAALWIATRGNHGLTLGDELHVDLPGASIFRSLEYDFDFN